MTTAAAAGQSRSLSSYQYGAGASTSLFKLYYNSIISQSEEKLLWPLFRVTRAPYGCTRSRRWKLAFRSAGSAQRADDLGRTKKHPNSARTSRGPEVLAPAHMPNAVDPDRMNFMRKAAKARRKRRTKTTATNQKKAPPLQQQWTAVAHGARARL